MSLVGTFSLVLLAGAFVFQVYQRITNKYEYTNSFRNLFVLSIVFIFGYYLFLVYSQYLAWSGDGGLGKFLTPPYQGIFYVFSYHFTRFLLHYLIAFAVAVIFLFSARHFNRRFGERFFEPAEPYLGALSIFLLGNPAWNYAWFYYLIAILAVAVIGSLVVSHLLKKSERFSLRFLWLPVAISVIIVMNFVT